MQLSGVSRRILVPFLGVVLVLIAELAWWITFQVGQSTGQARERLEDLTFQQDIAAQHVALHAALAAPNPPDPELPRTILQHAFPALMWTSGEPNNPVLRAYYPGHRVAIRPHQLMRIEDERHRRIRMFASEGLVFFGMVVAGVLLIVRALQREVGLIRQQGNFLSAVTHELKSPLASIRLYTETMQMREVPREKREHYLAAIRQDVDRLETLVGNLLTAARLDERRLALHPCKLDLVREVLDVIEQLRPEMQSRGVQLAVECPSQQQEPKQRELWVDIDPNALHTIVRNLLDNAAKYGVTAECNDIGVHLFADRTSAVLEVIDRGLGLGPADCERIFQKFYRVGDEMVRGAPGSGLGLYLVRALVRQSGGDVTAQSPGLGLGSTFRVTLPLSYAGREYAKMGVRRDGSTIDERTSSSSRR